jgi:hypothetical protein
VTCRNCKAVTNEVLFSLIRISFHPGSGECSARVHISIKRKCISLIYFCIVDGSASNGNDSVLRIGWINYIINSDRNCSGRSETDLHINFVADTKHIDLGAWSITGDVRIVSEMTFKIIFREC